MADERLRDLERMEAVGDPVAANMLKHERCRSGQCCAHKLSLEELEAERWDEIFMAVLREQSRRQMEQPGMVRIREAELRLFHHHAGFTTGPHETLVNMSNITAARLYDDASGKVFFIMVEGDNG